MASRVWARKKQNVSDDLAAAAEQLVAMNYTRGRQHVAIKGGFGTAG